MSASRDGEAGFTLLEALSAVAITASILAGLGAVAGQWLPNWRHGFVALQNADIVGLSLDRIVEDVAAAEYARLDGGQGAPLFRGETDAVAFVRQAIGPGATPRLEIVRIGASPTQQGVELQRSHAVFAPGAVVAFHDAATLLRPPFRLAFNYAGPDGQWRPAWINEAKLPRAVRLRVLNENGALVASTAFALKVTAAPEIAAQPTAKAADTPPDAVNQ
ncbi:MAG: general secretion pathway protein GspJ [Pseudomonadota bacterium]|nr:general secretion pathway protein GspJ [Pseudomonadota bacterium]